MPSLRRALQRLLRHQMWGLGIVQTPIESFLDPSFEPEVQWYSELAFAADPFLVEHPTGTYIFFEDFDYADHRGRISAVKYEKGQFHRAERDVLENDFHMSYPFCLEENGQFYCIPENSGSGQLVAYTTSEFPRGWQRSQAILQDVPAVDPTLIQHHGRWWLFCTRQDLGPCDSLSIYHSETLWGDWQPHAQNPVKVDARTARPAGNLFYHEGNFYRPAQDCSRVYGGAIVINKVLELSTTKFVEEEVRILQPLSTGPYPHGMHNISFSKNLTVIDGMRYSFNRHEFCFVLRDWVRRIAGQSR